MLQRVNKAVFQISLSDNLQRILQYYNKLPEKCLLEDLIVVVVVNSFLFSKGARSPEQNTTPYLLLCNPFVR